MFKLILAAALAGLAYAYVSLGSSSLEGTTWEVKVRKDAFLAWSHRDTLSFERGLLTSSRYLAKGFKPGGYASRGGQDASFQASQAGGDGASLEWRGAVHGDLVEGTVLWSRPGSASRTCTFRGRRKAE